MAAVWERPTRRRPPHLGLTPMKFLATLCILAFGGAALAADLEIAATGTTNNNNKVVVTFEVKNLGNQNVNPLNTVAELKINGNAIAAANYNVAWDALTRKGTVTVTGKIAPGMATVVIKANLVGPVGTVQKSKDVDLKMGMEEPIPDPIGGGGF